MILVRISIGRVALIYQSWRKAGISRLDPRESNVNIALGCSVRKLFPGIAHSESRATFPSEMHGVAGNSVLGCHEFAGLVRRTSVGNFAKSAQKKRRPCETLAVCNPRAIPDSVESPRAHKSCFGAGRIAQRKLLS